MTLHVGRPIIKHSGLIHNNIWRVKFCLLYTSSHGCQSSHYDEPKDYLRES